MNVCSLNALWTLLTENAEHQIQHYCNSLQIVRQKPYVKNYNEALLWRGNEYLTLGFDVLFM